VSWLKKSITHGCHTATVYAVQGLALQKQEKYNEAIASFAECLKTDSSHADAKRQMASCQYALAHTAPNDQIKLRASKVNTDGSEYGISPAAGEVFFSRAATKGADLDPRTGLGFTEIYSAKMEKTDLTNPKKEGAFMKMYYNTGVFAFDSLTNYMYTTVCDPKSGRCGIYRSQYNRRKWERPEPFLISQDHDMAHPALAKDGARLYFTSNASGGYGKTDIWYADRLSDDQWSEPVNAGAQINTAGRDEFPFVEGDRVLYFSSDGHLGFGGLDIFSVAMADDRFGRAENIGRPFNSGADDFNLISFGDRGLLISSRNLPKSDDIYIFDKKTLSPPSPSAEKEEPAAESLVAKEETPVAKEPIIVKEPTPTAEEAPQPAEEPVPAVKEAPQPAEEPAPIVKEAPQPAEEPAPVVKEAPQPVKEPASAVKEAPQPAMKPQEGVATFYYDFNLFVPQREYRQMYETVATLMKNHPNTKYVIEGFADDQGNEQFNREMSEKRAQYLRDRLVDRGVNPAMLRVEGFGDQKPAVPNASTEEEYRLNRRVVIRVDL
jgi:outer membrane protein OmpA-like peptidoglycan-associated protein